MNTNFWPLIKNSVTLLDRIRLGLFLLTTDKYTNGAKVKEFEQAWANWLGCRHAVMVNSGSSANLLLLSAVKDLYQLKDGDKVLVPACTWVTNISPVLQNKLTPVFCDINLENFSFDQEHLKQISQAHPDIKLIFVTHLLGFSAADQPLKELFPDAVVLDDVCESHGCLDNQGNRVGSRSTGATFSFYFGHHMTTVEGGMIVTDNPDLYDLLRMKRSHGMSRESIRAEYYADLYPHIDSKFLFVTDGYNVRSTEINAVLGLLQLSRLDRNIQKRKRNLKIFCDMINQYPDKFYPVIYNDNNSNYSFPIVCRNREMFVKLRQALKTNSIDYRPIVGGNLLRQPFLKNYKFGVSKKHYTVDTVNDQGLYIGNNPQVGTTEIRKLKTILEQL